MLEVNKPLQISLNLEIARNRLLIRLPHKLNILRVKKKKTHHNFDVTTVSDSRFLLKEKETVVAVCISVTMCCTNH